MVPPGSVHQHRHSLKVKTLRKNGLSLILFFFISLYAILYVLGVVVREDQQLCLHLGRSINIDMDSIIVAAVVTVRSASNVDNVSHTVCPGSSDPPEKY